MIEADYRVWPDAAENDRGVCVAREVQCASLRDVIVR